MAAAALAAAVGLAGTPDEALTSSAAGRMIGVIVRGDGGSTAAAERAAERFGARVERRLELIGGVAADVPADRVDRLRSVSGVASVTVDGRLRLLDADRTSEVTGPAGSLANVARTIGADAAVARGLTGAGVDVALIDSGVVPVDGLTGPGKVVQGPDLSFEADSDDLRHLDTYGHGTHLAGIIAADSGDVRGIAPGARLVSVKVAAADGATDVSQVIAALDWVVRHGRTGGLDVRVVNLAFGTDSDQPWLLDPLAYAAEQAWHAGIVVVVSAGNEGFGSNRVNNPATDPWLLAVGASDQQGTVDPADDTVASFSSRGDAARRPDLLAPGRSIVSLRDPGSWIDVHRPEGRVDDRLFKGSGTSQAAAVVSGAAALLLEQRPDLTPDQIKAALVEGARTLPSEPGRSPRGLDVARSLRRNVDGAIQSWPLASGSGSLEASRGSVHVLRDGEPFVGEVDVWGTAWTGSSWTGSSWTGSSWTGSSWTGSSWTGSSWTGSSWTGSSWTGSSWTGSSWTGSSWTGSSWTGSSWTGADWSS